MFQMLRKNNIFFEQQKNYQLSSFIYLIATKHENNHKVDFTGQGLENSMRLQEFLQR